jgi:hypothetical protein
MTEGLLFSAVRRSEMVKCRTCPLPVGTAGEGWKPIKPVLRSSRIPQLNPKVPEARRNLGAAKASDCDVAK